MRSNAVFNVTFDEVTTENLIYMLEKLENICPNIVVKTSQQTYTTNSLLALNVTIEYEQGMFSLTGSIRDLVAYLLNPGLSNILTNIANTYNDEHLENVHIRLTKQEFKEKVRVCRVKKSDAIETCSICQEDMALYAFKGVTSCGHHFHKRCISDWSTKFCEKPHCPLCRHDIREPMAN
jgi:hypothetical protein